MADTMKFLWGANSKIPAASTATTGKAYFATIDDAYADSEAPANEAFIYLDKAGKRYNVIAKRAIFDSLGYKIVDKYFTVASNNNSNMLQFFAPSQDVNTATPIGSATIITAIDLSNNSITASEYKIKTKINGFEDTTKDTNSTLALAMATDKLAGLVNAGEQSFGGQKTFTGKVIINSDLDVNGKSITIDGTTITNTAISSFTITAPTTNITASSALNITAPTAINGNTSITGTLGVTGVTNITNTTECNATNAAAALKVAGGVFIGKSMQVDGVAMLSNPTDASVSGGGVMVGGGIRVAKSAYICNSLTVAQAISNSRNATFNGTSVTNSYSTTIWGYLYGKNNTTLSRNVVLNNDETADTDTYTTTVKGKAIFNKEATFSNGVIITGGLNVTGDGIFSGDLYARGGEVVIGTSEGCATLSYNATTDTLTISFP